jgi:hypothetical protein
MIILAVTLLLSTLVFWVPALLVTHYLVFVVLVEYWPTRVATS